MRSRWMLLRTMAGLSAVTCLSLAPSVFGPSTASAASCSIGVSSVTCTYGAGSEQSLTLPSSVHSITVVAIGGTGGSDAEGDGAVGLGSKVTADLTLASNVHKLYIEVASNGSSSGAGGLSGGKASGGKGGAYYGSGTSGGGGGGASVVQTCSLAASGCTSAYYGSSDPRLVVAGGGGGEGGRFGGGGGYGGGGVGSGPFSGAGCGGGGGGGSGSGGSGQACQDGGGGTGATQTAAGAGGGGDAGAVGADGAHQLGGNGFPTSSNSATGGGGGGGGGYYGGGGGGTDENNLRWGGGGGAGSSWVNPSHVSGTPTYANDTSASPSVAITYSGTSPVPYAHLRVHIARGWTVLRWSSIERVAGYNLYAGRVRLNPHLVVSHTRQYHFRVHRVVRRPRLEAVPRD